MQRALILVCCLIASPASAQYSLEMTRPLPVGSAGSGWDAASPIYRAYQGMPYVRTIDVRGGTLPYRFSITSDSSGALSVSPGPCAVIGPTCTAGTLTLSNPTADFTYSVRVTDALGATADSGTISVDVNTNVCDSVGGWCFVDAVAGSGGDGSIGSPYDAISDVWNSTNRADRIMVLRGATADYVVTGMTQTTPDDCSQQVSWNESTRPVAWMGYPGESPVIDFGFDAGVSTSAPCMEFHGQNIWLQGFSAKNFRSIGWQFNTRTSGFGVYVGQVDFHDLIYGCDGCNSAFLEWSRSDTAPTQWDTVTQSRFAAVLADNPSNPNAAALKFYGTENPVVSWNLFDGSVAAEAMLAMKHAFIHGWVAGNVCDSAITCFGGNLNEDPGGTDSSATILHNYAENCGATVNRGCLTLGVAGGDFDIGAFSMTRNTWAGQIMVHGVSSDDGPYAFSGDVIVNSGGSASPAVCDALRLQCTSITDAAQIVNGGDNLTGAPADNIINGAGELQAAYQDYIGVSGLAVRRQCGRRDLTRSPRAPAHHGWGTPMKFRNFTYGSYENCFHLTGQAGTRISA